jgi:hypothetical protein
VCATGPSHQQNAGLDLRTAVTSASNTSCLSLLKSASAWQQNCFRGDNATASLCGIFVCIVCVLELRLVSPGYAGGVANTTQYALLLVQCLLPTATGERLQSGHFGFRIFLVRLYAANTAVPEHVALAACCVPCYSQRVLWELSNPKANRRHFVSTREVLTTVELTLCSLLLRNIVQSGKKHPCLVGTCLL